jgi:hypothetical protein
MSCRKFIVGGCKGLFIVNPDKFYLFIKACFGYLDEYLNNLERIRFPWVYIYSARFANTRD